MLASLGLRIKIVVLFYLGVARPVFRRAEIVLAHKFQKVKRWLIIKSLRPAHLAQLQLCFGPFAFEIQL
jgi:hypothetical protein